MSEVATKTKANPSKCHICGKTYTSVSVLNRHIQEVHKIEQRQVTENDLDVYNNKCFSCHKSFKYLRDLREHLVEKHDFVSEEEEHTFSDKEKFDEWFEETCKKEKVQYIIRRGTQKVRCEQGVANVAVYYCNRSGVQVVRLPPEQRKRATKTQGSRKLNYACTSQMKVTEFNGNYFVTYYKTHYQHDKDLKHLSILKSEKEEIARKLLAGLTPDEVLQEVREGAVDNDIRRINLLTRRDINNIKHRYKINEYTTSETVEYESSDENATNNEEAEGEIVVYDESSNVDGQCDLKRGIRAEIEAISSKIDGGDVQENVLQDVYELLQAATALLNKDGESESQSQKIETYFLTVDVDGDVTLK